MTDGGVERVAIDVGQRQRGQGVVPDQARGAAGAASPRREVEIAEAIPAKAGRPGHRWRGAGHGTSRSHWGSFSARCAAAMLVGWSCETLGKGLHGCVIAHDEIQHAGQESRVGGGGAQALRADSQFGQEQAQPLGLAGDEGQRLNRNDFSYFPGVVNRLFQLVRLPFANLWSLFCKHHARVCGTCSSKWKPLRRKTACELNGLERIWR